MDPAARAPAAAGPVGDIPAEVEVLKRISKEAVPTWRHLDLAQIEVMEVSGLGGSKTFKVSISEASTDVVPAAIAFHSRSEDNKLLLEERNIAAGRAFANAGVGPTLLAEAEDFRWCINEWTGEAIVEKYTGPGSDAAGVAAVEKMTMWSHAGELREHVGRLLGRVHQVPTVWAEPFLAQKPFFLSEPDKFPADKFPVLGFLGQKQSLEGFPPQMLERYGRAIDVLNTSTVFARRLVTLHADYHGGNILICDDKGAGAGAGPGFRAIAIDFEFANVGPAEFDLGYAFVANKALLNSAADKRAFIKGYLDAVVTAGSSDQVSPNDVENLLVDCEMASVKAFPPSEFIGVPDTDADTYEALVRRLAEFCSHALVPADPLKESDAANLRERLLEKGAFGLIREWHLQNDVPPPPAGVPEA